MRMANVLALVGLLQLAGNADPDLDALRQRVAVSSSRADAAAAASSSAERERDQAQAELADMERSNASGFFAQRRLRAAYARVRQRVEEVVRLSAEADDAAAEARRDRLALRNALFGASAAAGAAADEAAREGRQDEAAGVYAHSARLLAEASQLEIEPMPEDPWRGLDGPVPLPADATMAERAEVAAAYGRIADGIARELRELAVQLEAAESAASSFERLSRYRGVLERAGGPVRDPRPERDRLAELVRRGQAMEASLRQRATAVQRAEAPR